MKKFSISGVKERAMEEVGSGFMRTLLENNFSQSEVQACVPKITVKRIFSNVARRDDSHGI